MDEDIVRFFENEGFYNEVYFKIMEKKTIIINKNYEDIVELIGVVQNEDGTDFRIYLPKITCFKDFLIHVHEYSHSLFLDDDDELFPNIMELYFIKKYVKNIKILNDIIYHTINEINNSIDDKHTIAKKVKLKELVKFKDNIIN